MLGSLWDPWEHNGGGKIFLLSWDGYGGEMAGLGQLASYHLRSAMEETESGDVSQSELSKGLGNLIGSLEMVRRRNVSNTFQSCKDWDGAQQK